MRNATFALFKVFQFSMDICMATCNIRICMVWCFWCFLSFIVGYAGKEVWNRDSVFACCVRGIVVCNTLVKIRKILLTNTLANHNILILNKREQNIEGLGVDPNPSSFPPLYFVSHNSSNCIPLIYVTIYILANYHPLLTLFFFGNMIPKTGTKWSPKLAFLE